MKKNKVIFLDRDGVINYDENYVHLIEDFRFIEEVFDACLRFIDAGYQIVIITNQAGIGRGYYSENDFKVLNNWMLTEFKKQGIDILGVYYCPHHSEYAIGDYLQDCECRKPEPGMLIKAMVDHNIDMSSSLLVGDKLSDIKAGRLAGVQRCFFVETGKIVTDSDRVHADGVLVDLAAVAELVCNSRH